MSTFRRNTGIADALKSLRDLDPPSAVEEQGSEESTPKPAPRGVSQPGEKRGPGRPIGKRGNPDYKQYTVLLKGATHREALENLRRKSARPDFSDLLETLIAAWNRKQK